MEIIYIKRREKKQITNVEASMNNFLGSIEIEPERVQRLAEQSCKRILH